MNLKSTLNRWILALAFSIGVGFFTPATAQYCSPTFAFGCNLWETQSITLGPLNWYSTGVCTDNDFTSTTVMLTTGVPHFMTVTNGQWCGCAVWIDYNNDFNFDVSENQFYDYVAGAGGVNTYNIYITIPNGTPTGPYRMRVISPWGSDGLTTANGNGQGPCGAYQNGNFQDFTLVVAGPQATEDLTGDHSRFISSALNAESSQLTAFVLKPNASPATLQLIDVTGRVIETRKVTSEKEVFDLSTLSSGVFFLNYFDGEHRQNIKLSK